MVRAHLTVTVIATSLVTSANFFALQPAGRARAAYLLTCASRIRRSVPDGNFRQDRDLYRWRQFLRDLQSARFRRRLQASAYGIPEPRRAAAGFLFHDHY